MLEIKDNGIGFNVAEKQQIVTSGSGVGLKSMFNRARLIGADMTLKSEPGKGASLLIELPL
jgi:signal transduction histidine kinase